MTVSALELEKVRKRFSGNRLVDGISLTVEPGSVTAIIGANGAGKTTLLRCISGQLRIDGGRVELSGRSIGHMPAWKRARLGLGWTYQDVMSPLSLTIRELFSVAEAHKAPTSTRQEATGALPTKASSLLAMVAPFLDQSWQTLSFGQRKLAALAILISRRCSVLLLDEPAAGLSQDASAIAADAIISERRRGAAVILVDHNRRLIAETADRVFELQEGHLFDRTSEFLGGDVAARSP